MGRRNVANLSVFNDVIIDNLTIQSYGPGLTIYSTTSTTPVFIFDPTLGLMTINGNLNVTGTANFTSINVSQWTGGLFNLAYGNLTDALDIGLDGEYNNGFYSGIIRQASDSLKRWTFFQNTTVPPTSVITGITSSTLAPVRMSQLYVNDGTVSSPAIIFDLDASRDTGFYRISEGAIGISCNATNIVTIQPAGADFVNGSVVNIGTSGLTSTLNINGAVNNYGIASFTGIGSTTPASSTIYVAPVSTAATGSNTYYYTYFNTPAITGTTLGSAYTVFIAGAPSGAVTSPFAFYIASGISSIQQLITNGLITANSGITVLNGQVANIGTSGLTSTLNVFGALNGSGTASFTGLGNTTASSSAVYIAPVSTTASGANNYYFTHLAQPSMTGSTTGSAYSLYIAGSPTGTITNPYSIYVAAGLSFLQATTFGGLITANAGITSINGQTVSVGTSGITSTLNVFGPVNGSSTASFTGLGNTTASSSTVYIAPVSTTASGANNYYFTHLAQPAMTGSTTGSAYSLYIAGAPTGTITNPYSIYVAAGLSFLQATTFGGLITANAGITSINGQTISVGTSGITSTLSVFGASNLAGISSFTGIGGVTAASSTVYISPASTTLSGANDYYFTYLTQPPTTSSTSGIGYTMYIAGAPSGTSSSYSLYIASGASYLQALTANGLLTANAGITSADGQTVSIGTTGTSSLLYVYGQSAFYGKTIISGVGLNTPDGASIHVTPLPTTFSTGTYYFTRFSTPSTSGSTAGSAYTVYIQGAPANATTPYALYVASGKTYIGGELQVAGGISKSVTVDSTNTIALTNSMNIVESSFAGAVAMTLPDVTLNAGHEFIIIKTGASGSITIGTTSAQTIDDGVSTSIVLTTQYDRVTLIAGSTQYYTV